jgi:hypothetical protein
MTSRLTDVCHDEQALEFLEGVFINLAAWCEIREIIGQPAVALVDASAQTLDEAFLFLGLFLFPKHTVTILDSGRGDDGQTKTKC